MKILLIASFRCGSYSVLDWLRDELNLKVFGEYDIVDVDDNYVVKRVPDLELLKNIDKYDYVIRLYRHDTLMSAESNIFAIINNKWRQHNNERYELNEKFLIDNHDLIINSKIEFDESNKLLKNINAGILISYEEIFEENIGQKLLEEYLNFESKTSLNIPQKKFRRDNFRTRNVSLDYEIKLLKEKNLDLVDKIIKTNEANKELLKTIKELKSLKGNILL